MNARARTKAPRHALVLGVNGQDGSYVAEHLLAREWRVTGVGRQAASRHVEETAERDFRYRTLDVTDLDALGRLLAEARPDAILHFAAVHGPAGFDYESAWKALHLVNTGVTHRVLEHLRRSGDGGRLLYPSSAKAFGSPLPSRVSEATPRVSACLYSITKNASHDLVDYYRRRHGVKANVVTLFNHESPRRPPAYLVPTLVEALAAALGGGRGRDSSEETPHASGEAPRESGKPPRASEENPREIRTWDFFVNLGDAREYMELCAEIIDRELEGDAILAHERTWHGRELGEALFSRYGLDVDAHVRAREGGGGAAERAGGERPPAERPPAQRPPAERFEVDTSRLRALVGRTPSRDILDVCDDILRANHPEAAV